MRKTIRLSLAAGAIAVLAAVAVPLVAQGRPGPPPMGGVLGGPGPGGPHGGPRGRGPGGPGGPMGALGELGPALRNAGVTEEQHQQIKSVMDSHRDEFQAIGERMRTAHQALRAVVEAETIDENAIRAKSQEVGTVEADMAILGAKVRAEVIGLLTAEQLEKVKAFRAEMQKRFEQGQGQGRRRPGR